jgi:hypothetical protein
MPSTCVFPMTTPFSYSVTRIPHFDTRSINYGGKVRQRVSFSANPWYEIVCRFDNITDVIADGVMTFFEARKGSYEAFLLQNPEEAYRSTKWVPNTAYAVNSIRRPITINDHSYKVISGGVSATAEPSWTTTPNATVSDGSIVWAENTYLVTFAEDSMNAEYFTYAMYSMGEVRMIQVST